MRYILTLNAGSSSLKYALYSDSLQLVDEKKTALEMLPELFAAIPKDALIGIGHRVVHGGKKYTKSSTIDATLLDTLDELTQLAPLHNGLAVQVIKACSRFFGPNIFQLAVFDTTFFRTMPAHSRYYAIPKKYGIERFGFHGIAHESLWNAYVALTGNKEAKVITLQLGAGSSIAAIDKGIAQDTSMGYTPNEGLVMATRSGDIDPQVVRKLGQDAMHILNYESGLLGLSESSSDMQRLIEEDPNQLAIELYCYRIVKYIGAYIAALGGLDALIFSGGIGENAPLIRQKILSGLEWYFQGSSAKVYVIPSGENRFIGQQVLQISKDERTKRTKGT